MASVSKHVKMPRRHRGADQAPSFETAFQTSSG